MVVAYYAQSTVTTITSHNHHHHYYQLNEFGSTLLIFHSFCVCLKFKYLANCACSDAKQNKRRTMKEDKIWNLLPFSCDLVIERAREQLSNPGNTEKQRRQRPNQDSRSLSFTHKKWMRRWWLGPENRWDDPQSYLQHGATRFKQESFSHHFKWSHLVIIYILNRHCCLKRKALAAKNAPLFGISTAVVAKFRQPLPPPPRRIWELIKRAIRQRVTTTTDIVAMVTRTIWMQIRRGGEDDENQLKSKHPPSSTVDL